ncbi:hypothetical protein [Streptomyces sp. CB03911]|uniref:hypothetical protein n=1 Tax=Streptomycetaceae TaxID=2062 RepID=UPI00093FC37C|nr:hypothetical protein [Streptomyces sp. CB03911]OKI24306.1 hypothetical protein A6A07_05380 [Streptomyces sp. CB03911]
MSEHPTPSQSPAGPAPEGAPAPEGIRWFGTSWVGRGSDYRLRRVLVPVGALLAAAAGALLLRFGVQGVQMSDAGTFVNGLLVAAVAVCSCLAALRNWKLLSEGREALTGWMAEDKSLGAVWIIGGVGALLAYFVRSLVEAPGEAVARARHEQAVERYGRRQANRSRRPDTRAPGRGKRRS